MKFSSFVAATVVSAAASVSFASTMTAYNDFNAPNLGVANTTTITSGQNGNLVDITSGTPFATLAVASHTLGAASGPAPSGEAGTYFAGYVNVFGYMYTFGTIVNSLVFSNLDTSKEYDLVLTGYPGNKNSDIAGSNGLKQNLIGVTLVNAQSFTNATTVGAGVTISGAGSASTSVYQDGSIVIHYSNIKPTGTGMNGTFAINEFKPADAVPDNTPNRIGALRLQASSVPEPAGLSLVGLATLPLLRRRRHA